jgi:hypothetical protein
VRISRGRCRWLLVSTAVVVPLVLSSCSGSATRTSAPTTAPPGLLSKAAFIAKADAVCDAANTNITALPRAHSDSDYPALLTDFTSTLTIFQTYFAQAEALVAVSTDRATLSRKWLTVEEGDFAASRPLIERIIAALQAKDDSAVRSLDKKLQAAPDHTDQLIVFFKSYGLGACASLESGPSYAS